MAKRMQWGALLMALGFTAVAAGRSGAEPLGLPPVPIPADNPQTPEKIALGDKLFHDARFSGDGTISCSTCHADEKAFTDSPRKTSRGIRGQFGTRNAPTVINSAYFHSLFLDGRASSLEDQSQIPRSILSKWASRLRALFKSRARRPRLCGGVQQGLPCDRRRGHDRACQKSDRSYERTLISGDSPFDRWYFQHDAMAISEAAKRGFEVYVGQGRCVSCHVIEQDQALFTDNRFHKHRRRHQQDPGRHAAAGGGVPEGQGGRRLGRQDGVVGPQDSDLGRSR